MWRKTNKTDLAFLNELAQKAKAAAGGGGYRVYLDSSKDPPVLHFHPDRGQNYPLHRDYVVQTDRMGTVLAFSPEIDGAALLSIGASQSALVYRDPNTRKLQETVATPSTATDGVALGTKTAVDGTIKVKQAIPPSSKAEAQSRLDSYYEKVSWSVSKATLEVVGDPFLEPGKLISVVVKTPNNEKYFVSGIYLIENVTHTINPGEFTSSLSLLKNAYDVGDQGVRKGTVQRGR